MIKKLPVGLIGAGLLATLFSAPAIRTERGYLYWQGEGHPYGYYGRHVAGVGDADGDGYADFAVGEPLYIGPGGGRGRVYLHSGRTKQLLHLWEAEGAYSHFGRTIKAAGDMDRDGCSDVLVSATGDGATPGKVYAFSGRSGNLIRSWTRSGQGRAFGSGLSGNFDADRDGWPDVLVGTLPNGGVGYAFLFSGQTGALIRSWTRSDDGRGRVAGIKDVDGDGHDDVALSATFYRTSFGRVLVYSGRTDQLLLTLNGEYEYGYFGEAIESAGDVDGDGRGDLAVGSVHTRGEVNGRGQVSLFSGRTGVLIHAWEGENDGDLLGSVGTYGGGSFAFGDVNGDRTPDLVVGAPGYADYRGKAYAFSGSTGNRFWAAEGTPENYFGEGVGFAGDVNRDGYGDIIIGTSRSIFVSYKSTGRAYVFLGEAPLKEIDPR